METLRDTEELKIRLDQTRLLREKTQATIKVSQKRVEELFAQLADPRPRESVDDLRSKARKLQTFHETHSLPLQEEKELIRQIEKYQIQCITIENHQKTMKAIDEAKEGLAALRASLKEQNRQILDGRNLYQALQSARSLNCNLEELQSMKLKCPPSHLGRVLGRGGKNLKSLREKHNVHVDVIKIEGREEREIQFTGASDSIRSMARDLTSLINRVERQITVSQVWAEYVRAPHIDALGQLRERHPDVFVSPPSEKEGVYTVRAFGEDLDLSSLEEDLGSAGVVRDTINVPKSTISTILGKEGTTIKELTNRHKAIVQVSKSIADELSNDSEVVVVGTIEAVQFVREEIGKIVADHSECEEMVLVEPEIRKVLLLQRGEGIRSLRKETADATSSLAPGSVTLTLGETHLALKGKFILVQAAEIVVENELKRIMANTTSMNVDRRLVTLLIGPKGSTITQFGKLHSRVNIELDVKKGNVSLSGLNLKDVHACRDSIADLFVGKGAKTIFLPQYTKQIELLQRSSIPAQLSTQKVELIRDPDSESVFIRGDESAMGEAEKLLLDFVGKNCVNVLELDSIGIQALVEGGKDSKVSHLAEQHNVRIDCNRDACTATVQGGQQSVNDAAVALRQFVFGGNDSAVVHVILDDMSLPVVIGRRGSTRVELAKKHGVLLQVQSEEKRAYLRGPADNVESCRVAILQLIASAPCTQTIPLPPEDVYENKSRLEKESRHLMKVIPTVKINIGNDEVIFKGPRPHVKDSIAMFQETVKGYYVCELSVEDPTLFAALDAAHSKHFPRIQQATKAQLSLEQNSCSVVLTGTHNQVREAKIQLFGAFCFLFPSKFERVLVPKPFLNSVGELSNLVTVEVDSKASVKLDRDTASILIFAEDREKIATAQSCLEKTIEEEKKGCAVLSLSPSEKWILSILIGKGGKEIKEIRRSTNCRIEIDTDVLQVVVSADSSDFIQKGKEVVEEIIERERAGFIEIPDADFPAFIGRKGDSVRKFETEHDVSVHVLRDLPVTAIRLTGGSEAIANAVEACKIWLNSQAMARQQAEMREVMPLRRGQVPMIIGPKGATIRSLRSEFGCRIEVPRSEPYDVAVIGGSEEKRRAAMAKIRAILSPRDDEDPADSVPGSAPVRSITSNTSPSKKFTAPQKDVFDKLNKEEVFPRPHFAAGESKVSSGVWTTNMCTKAVQ